jgi:hypothetical protein
MDVRFRSADFNRFIPHVKPKIVFLIGRARGYNIAKTIKKLSSDFDSNIKYYNVGGEEIGTSFDDLLKSKVTIFVGDSGGGGSMHIIPLIFRDYLGLNIKIV